MALGDVTGQDNALRILRGAMQRGRVASSYLFAGDDGVGKRFTAVNFAKALNCTAPVSGDACEACPSCRKINASTHPDFKVVEVVEEFRGRKLPGNEIIVEQIREVDGFLSLKPYEGATKAVVVDGAEKMNISAANAFLKTLEEPAPRSLIVLVSANPEWLPQTIRSRCSRVNFTPLSPPACEAVIASALGRKIKDKAKLSTLVRLSMGRPGQVLEHDPVKERDRFLKSLEKLLSREGKHPWRDRSDMQRWLQSALVLLRDMAVMGITGSPGDLVNADIAAEIKRMAGRAEPETISECYGKLRGIMEELRFNPNRALVWNYAGSILEGAGIGV